MVSYLGKTKKAGEDLLFKKRRWVSSSEKDYTYPTLADIADMSGKINL